ncbi:MAG TPA: hypothetical protein VFV86_05040 [Nitrososphaeraceae archaeon]|nr:hypothetical protein [Nitrososphaeraceae archaeon]
MKKLFIILPLFFLTVGCSGPEIKIHDMILTVTEVSQHPDAQGNMVTFLMKTKEITREIYIDSEDYHRIHWYLNDPIVKRWEHHDKFEVRFRGDLLDPNSKLIATSVRRWW